MLVGDRIRERRKVLGLSLSELGSRLGISAAAVSRYELGQRAISIDLLEKLAKALDISPVELLGRDPTAFENAVNKYASKFGGDGEEYRRGLLETNLSIHDELVFTDALVKMESFVDEALSDVEDSAILKMINSSLFLLNRRGKLAAYYAVEAILAVKDYARPVETYSYYAPEDGSE